MPTTDRLGTGFNAATADLASREARLREQLALEESEPLGTSRKRRRRMMEELRSLTTARRDLRGRRDQLRNRAFGGGRAADTLTGTGGPGGGTTPQGVGTRRLLGA